MDENEICSRMFNRLSGYFSRVTNSMMSTNSIQYIRGNRFNDSAFHFILNAC